VHDVVEKRGEMESTELLHAWAQHLDSLGVEHSSVIQAGAGSIVVLADPDGIFLASPTCRQAASKHKNARRQSRTRRPVAQPTTDATPAQRLITEISGGPAGR
jgi:hypothetical protein